jgi:hypothetical protein
MFKNKTTRLLLILGVAVAAFAVVKFTSSSNRSKSYRDVLVTIDTAKVSKIEIDETGSNTVLTKTDDNWTVEVDGNQKNVVNNTVKALLSTIQTIEPSRLASRSENKWKDFSVDSSGTRVRIYEGGKVALDIVLGRFGVEGQRSFYSYVRLSEEADTYIANNFMKMSISSKSEDFRNSNIIRLNKDSLNTIAFNYPDSSVVLAKNGDTWYNDRMEADSANTSQYLSSLRFVTSKLFANVDELGTPTLSVTFSFQNQPEIQISAYKIGNDWIISSSENEDEVWIDPAQFSKVFVSSSQF